MSNRDDVAQMSPGSFRESSQADRVFFVESGDGKDGKVKNIFVSTTAKGKLGVMVAGDGYTQTVENGDRFVVMLDGRRYEGVPGSPEYRVMEFERYAVRIETKEAQGVESRPYLLTVDELLADPTPPNMGEFAFRVGLPIAAINLALLAIPLSFVNPRAGTGHQSADGAADLPDVLEPAEHHAGLGFAGQAVAVECVVGPARHHVRAACDPVRMAYVFACAACLAESMIHERYIRREVALASLLVLASFLGLFGFFDLINELDNLGRGNYGLEHAVMYTVLTMPGRVYETLPIAVLIGGLYALTTLSRHSEITVLRASGVSTAQLLRLLARIGTPFVLLTFVTGEFIAPPAEKAAQELKLAARSQLLTSEFRSGFWIKDEHNFVNVGSVTPDGKLQQIRIFEFDDKRVLLSVSEAARAAYAPPEAGRCST
jgi:lipopolysaccharide export LptBFGC system permease protein LptF